MIRNLFSRLTIRQRLSLLICSLLLSVILVFGVISYLGVRKASLKVGRERLYTLSQQLSNMLSENTYNLIAATYDAANRQSVKTYLLSNGKDSTEEVNTLFKDLLKDSAHIQVQLLNAEQRILLNSAKQEIASLLSFHSVFANIKRPDSGRVGKFYAIGNSVFYPTMAAVVHGNKIIGYMIRWRKMQASSKAVEQILQLMGTDARFFVGNSDGSVWTDLMQPLSLPPYGQGKKDRLIQHTRSGKEVFASVHPVANSQWIVSVEFPKNKILQTANNYLYWLLIAGGLVLIAGIFFGWLTSRNISNPLVKLTEATSQIAAGNYSSQVSVDRFDELGKLARSFNTMSAQVQNSQKELEEKAENYKLLFEKNPMPMWIMSTASFDILDVNEAAISHYGYSREEFLKLNSKELRPDEDVQKFLEVAGKDMEGRKKHGIWRHKKKDGAIIMVDVIADDIIYQKQPARLTLALDITEKLKAEAELVRHRIMQQEIITETTILVQEKEREEIGKELHDNINQILASTKLYLELARSGNKELLPDAISKSYENINLAIDEIRQLSKQLVKPAFDTTLTDSLRNMTEELQAITPIEISFNPSRFNEDLVDENIKLMVYRIVQEQFNNILKHAAASEVKVNLKTDHENIYLSIEDNGVGFDINKKPKGIGLRNIDHRVKFHKGIVSIHSKPGEGCTIKISVPLKTESAMNMAG